MFRLKHVKYLSLTKIELTYLEFSSYEANIKTHPLQYHNEETRKDHEIHYSR